MSKLRSCRPSSRALAKFLRKHADGIPESEIRSATSKKSLPDWTTWCDRKGVAAVMRSKQNDWYLCTLKNAAVRPDLRGQGIGSKLYGATADKARKNKSCLVLAADVTVTNKPSIKALKSAGFKSVSKFCWAKGEKPADIMHFVKMPTRGGQCK